MTELEDLFDLIDLEQAVESGYVRTQTHPTLPYVIYNYAEKAVFEKVWTPVTRQCRGLIAHAETGEIIARPFEKFFNHNEPLAPAIGLDEAVITTDKIDGSLGILYPCGNGEFAIATRGSFASEQAIHATALLQERYAAGTWEHNPHMTYLFEIVYPENRIVVDYQGQDDLVLLGAVHIGTGLALSPRDLPEWPGPRAEEFEYDTYAHSLAAPLREGKEGLVVSTIYGERQRRVKIKQDEYVRLHRIVTGLNARAVWEAIGAGQSVEQICAELPDEFHVWTKDVADRLVARASDLRMRARREHAQIIKSLPDGWSRKDYALIAKDAELRGYLFRLLDGRDVAEMAWKAAYPEGNWTPSGRAFSEATA